MSGATSSVETNIVDQIFAGSGRARSQVALIADDREVTYDQLEALVEALAARLGATPVLERVRANQRGVARIGLYCADGIAHVVLALAVLRSGACLVPVAPELTPPERDALIDSVSLDAVVSDGSRRWHRMSESALDIGVSLAGRGVSAGLLELATSRTGGQGGAGETELAALRPAFVRFSSGTTGTRKGIVLSHRALFERVSAANRALGVGPDDRVVWMLPMAHHFAVSIVLYLVHGATTVLTGSHLAPDVLAQARRHRGTLLYGAPFHHALLAGEPSGLPWPDLRLAISTAAPLPVVTARAFEARFGAPLCQALGIIEVGLPTVNLARAREKPVSVGRPTPGFEVWLRGESGSMVSPGDVGEVLTRGPGMLDAYLSPWCRRESVLHDGWFATGDLGRLDEEGDLFLVGRTSTVINVAGMKCFPEEVEAVLRAHPDVAAARVTGREHRRVGQVPWAEIVPRDPATPPSVGALAGHCRDRLASYKIPIEFRLVESLPKTASGKIARPTQSERSAGEIGRR